MTLARALPPFSVQAEQYTLGCCINDNGDSLASCVGQGITPAHFYVPANAIIYARLIQMLSESKPIDLSVLAEELTRSKDFEAIGGYEHLVEVSRAAPMAVQLRYFLSILREMQILRQVLKNAQQIIESCANYVPDGTGVQKMLDPLLNRLLTESVGMRSNDEQTFDEVLAEAELEAKQKMGLVEVPVRKTLPFFLDDMNKLFGEMERGSLVFFAGPPSSGKSSAARQQAVHLLEMGCTGYFVTLEVKPSRVVLNIAQSVTRLSIKELGNPKTHPGDKQDFLKVIRNLKNVGLTITKVDRTLARIVARATALHAQRKLDFIVLDHGLLLEDLTECDRDEREPLIGKITATFKRLAQDLDCVVILLWQLTGSAVKQGHKFKASDMKGSAALEADGDKVILVERPPKDLAGNAQDEHIHVKTLPTYYQQFVQAKGRDDGVATVAVEFSRAIATFREILKEEPTEHQPTMPFG